MAKHVIAQRVLWKFRRPIYLLDISPFLESIVLCLSIRIRGYYEPNFHIPLAAISLHFRSCEI